MCTPNALTSLNKTGGKTRLNPRPIPSAIGLMTPFTFDSLVKLDNAVNVPLLRIVFGDRSQCPLTYGLQFLAACRAEFLKA